MDADIWRVPTLFGVMACSSLLLFAAGALASHYAPGAITRAAGIQLLLAISTAFAIRTTASGIARALDISVSYVDPGPLGYIVPVAFAAFAFVVGKRLLKGTWTGWRALLFYGWLVVFTAANVINWCAPGWCATIGFPFPWHIWSDSILTVEDNRFAEFVGTFGSVIAAVLDLLTFIGVSSLLARLPSSSRVA